MRKYEARPERKLDVHCLSLVEPVNDQFAAAVDYHNDQPFKEASRWDDDAAHELYEIAKKIAVQMKERNFSGKGPMWVIVFLQKFKSACDAREIRKGGTLSLFKKFLIGSTEAAVNTQVTLVDSTNVFRKGALKSYSAIVWLFLRAMSWMRT